jgi:hypothetical protein
MSAACLWTVKTMAGAVLGTFTSHADAVERIEARQAEPDSYPDWCGDLRILPAPIESAPLPPFVWAGCTLGLGSDIEPVVDFVDSTGQRWKTYSVEYILANIDHFHDHQDRYRLLAGAALHYGFDDVWTLIKGRDYRGRT